MLRETVVASAILAAAVAAVAGLSGHLAIGLGIAAGLVLGSANGYAIAGLMGAPIMVASIARLSVFTALLLLIAFVLGTSAWPVALGVGLAQLVLVAAGIRQGLRA